MLCDFSPIASDIRLFTYICIEYVYMLFFEWLVGWACEWMNELIYAHLSSVVEGLRKENRRAPDD